MTGSHHVITSDKHYCFDIKAAEIFEDFREQGANLPSIKFFDPVLSMCYLKISLF